MWCALYTHTGAHCVMYVQSQSICTPTDYCTRLSMSQSNELHHRLIEVQELMSRRTVMGSANMGNKSLPHFCTGSCLVPDSCGHNEGIVAEVRELLV